MTLGKSAAIHRTLEAAAGVPTVFTTGYASRIGLAAEDRPSNFYMTGSMGLALSVGIGLAMTTRRRTLVVDGDGSLLMNPSGLITAGASDSLPLLHLLLNDGVYDSTGGQASPGHRVDLAAWAQAAGYPFVVTVSTTEELTLALETALRLPQTLSLIQCLVSPDATAPPPRVTEDLKGIAARFAASVQPQ
ncbi:thiamine pyrophosphate-dependent enzyme [Micromonospora echinospora]|uniref:thiamine pyrophosphate-dependent enzyme n=1 Tax=Micromonospora echinospora TaxID=1877 RepID=UPI00379DD8EB